MLLVAGGGWVGLASRPSGGPDPAGVQAGDSGELPLRDPALSAATGVGPAAPLRVGSGNTELFFKMMFSVVLVIGLGIGALYLSKKVLPKVTNGPGKEIRILETTCLGPRKALHLVEVGNQRLLIASTTDTITALAQVSDAWLEVSRQEMDDTLKVG